MAYAGGGTAPANGLYAGLTRRAYTRRLPRPPARPRADGAAGRHLFPTTVALTEITGSESFVHLEARRHELGRRAARRPRVPARPALEAALDPNDIFVFDPDGRLVAAPHAGVRTRAMARIDLVDLAHSYGGNPPTRELRAEADR